MAKTAVALFAFKYTDESSCCDRDIESLKDIAPDLGHYIIEFGFGDVSRDRDWICRREK